MLLEAAAGAPAPGYLPVFQPGDPFQPQWAGQESVAFPDNWSIGLSFYHNLFAREHNSFVDEFRKEGAKSPNSDSGLRNPSDPARVIHNKDVTPDELFEVARLWWRPRSPRSIPPSGPLNSSMTSRFIKA
jgi:hypothetical protein